jgi:ABC-type nitrate/sulfonate/bicarbonate transport system substrate-binding protein
VAVLSPTLPVLSAAQGFHVKIIMALQDRIIQQTLVRPDVAKKLTSPVGQFPAIIRELRGTTLGITARGGATDVNLRYLVRAAGLDPEKDVHIVPTGSPQGLLSAMQNGSIEGMQSIEPLSDVLVRSEKAVNVLDLAKGQGPAALKQPFIVAIVTDSFLQHHRDLAQKYVAAMVETATFIRDPANQEKVLQIAQNDVLQGMPREVALDMVLELIGTMRNLRFEDSDLTNVETVLRVAGLLTTSVQGADVIDYGLQPGR